MGIRRASAALIAGLIAISSLAPAGAAAQAPPTRNGLPSLAPVLKEVTPAVVNIAVISPSPLESNPLYQDPFFRRFFNLPEKPKPQISAGSGVIVDADKGHVLTNHHVVKDATQIIVTLKDRRQFEAKLIGSDPGTDIAVLKIEAKKLKAIRLGDSDFLEVGDHVLAIGNPFGLGQTVTSGIVSALGRSGLDIEGYEDFIQTDASINPGNSGGALIDHGGSLVGINTAIIGPAGGNVGIGFAVPINMAQAVMGQIIRFGEVRRGLLGVETQDLTPDLAESLGLSQTEGAVIVGVEPKSPAAKAGLKVRDVVVGANGRPVRGSGDLRNKVGLVPIGESVEFQVLRGGRTMTIRAVVGEPPAVSGAVGQRVPVLAGATFANIEPGMPAHGRVEGVVVTRVERGSPAYRAGLRPADVVYAVNRQKIRSVQDFTQALSAVTGRLALSLLRGDTRLTLLIT